MTDILLSIGLVLVLVMVGGVFAAGEMALVSLREGQLNGLAARGPRGERVRELASNPNRFLATVQIGVTLSGFLSAAFGEATLSSKLRPVLVDAGLAKGFSDVIATIIITLIVAYFALVLGELAPKRIALQRAESIAVTLAPALDRMAIAARPAIWLLSRSTNLIVRLLGGDPTTSREAITEEELRGLVASHENLTHEERQLIDDVFAAGERQVSEVMVPRTEVVFLEGGMTISRAVRAVADSPHSRYPVVGEGRDDVIGFVHIRDLLAPDRSAERTTTVGSIAREVLHLPGSKKVLAALSEMRRDGSHVAIVVDEYGGTDGIVTLEDLIEEVIGDIHDEYDVLDAAGARTVAGETEVDGRLNLDEFAEATGLVLPPGPYETAAGYVMGALGRLPSVDDTVTVDGHTIQVRELDGRRVARLLVTTVSSDPAGSGSVPPARPAADPPAGDGAPTRPGELHADQH